MATRQELYRDVLENLGVVDAETPADASDTQVVAARYAKIYAMLRNEKMISWALDGDIPEYAVDPMVNILSHRLARKFGQSPADYQGDARIAVYELRRQLAPDHVSFRPEAEYF